MKVNSISGVTYNVEDLSKTAEFYEALGFRRGKEEPDRVTFYVNWFFVTFVAGNRENGADERSASNGSGMNLCLKVDDVKAFYDDVLSSGMTPEGEPARQASGNREFVLTDPDGYKLAFFEKK